MSDAINAEQHLLEMKENLLHWQRKPLLRLLYQKYYLEISRSLRRDVPGPVVEIGSGLGNIRSAIPDCLLTDIFPTPWADQVETAYQMSFPDGSVSNLILFDVFHHLQYPGNALMEFYRVLHPGGRVVIFDPAMGLLGLLVFGLFHHEPLGLRDQITLQAPPGTDFSSLPYYAAQANASRMFSRFARSALSPCWKIVSKKTFSGFSYVGSGGYRGPQLYPKWLFPAVNAVDSVCNLIPWLFATRLLVVLEKTPDASSLRGGHHG